LFVPRDIIRRLRTAHQHYLKDASFRTRWLFTRRLLMLVAGRRVPVELWLGVTHRCQCRCVHCFVGDRLNSRELELSGNEIRDVIDIARRAGVLELIFFGGEPLLREDTVDHIGYARSRGLLPTLYTNGVLLDEPMVQELRRAGLNRCNVSLDSAVAEVHDTKRRHPGCWDQAVAGLERLVSNDMTACIWTYASKQEVRDNGMKDLRNIISLGRKMGVSSVVILFPIASGNWACATDEVLTLEEREKVRTLWDPPFVHMEHPTESTMCTAGRRFLYVSPQGELIACPCIPFSYGNIRTHDFMQLAERVTADMCQYYDRLLGECIMQKPEFQQALAEKKGEPEEPRESGQW
jgi:MoaA/NifB/PqqE/SkfB family radical SAM enzyme